MAAWEGLSNYGEFPGVKSFIVKGIPTISDHEACISTSREAFIIVSEGSLIRRLDGGKIASAYRYVWRVLPEGYFFSSVFYRSWLIIG